jgi:hypothetical protein
VKRHAGVVDLPAYIRQKKVEENIYQTKSGTGEDFSKGKLDPVPFL